LVASLSQVLDLARSITDSRSRGVIIKVVNDTEFYLGLDTYGAVWFWNYVATDGSSGRAVTNPAVSVPPGGAVAVTLPFGSNTATVHGPVVPVAGSSGTGTTGGGGSGTTGGGGSGTTGGGGTSI
jgi:hypothetical protein